MQIQLQLQGQGLLMPMGAQTCRRDHDHAAVATAHQSSGGQQGREGLAQAHRIGQDSTAAGEQPAGGMALVSHRLAAIGQLLLKGSRPHQLTVGGQGRQRLTQPAKPAGQLRGDREATRQRLIEARRCLQREFPAGAMGQPAASRPNAAQLGLCHGVEGRHHLDQTTGAQTHLHQRENQGIRQQPSTH